MYTIRPTTTGGSPIRAFRSAIIKRLNLNLFTAKTAASGNANNELITKAESVT